MHYWHVQYFHSKSLTSFSLSVNGLYRGILHDEHYKNKRHYYEYRLKLIQVFILTTLIRNKTKDKYFITSWMSVICSCDWLSINNRSLDFAICYYTPAFSMQTSTRMLEVAQGFKITILSWLRSTKQVPILCKNFRYMPTNNSFQLINWTHLFTHYKVLTETLNSNSG